MPIKWKSMVGDMDKAARCLVAKQEAGRIANVKPKLKLVVNHI